MKKIPPSLRASASQRTADFVSKVRKAMAKIELEIGQNDGLYPFNKGRLNQKEVCRRAGVSDVTLALPKHKNSTKVELQTWLSRVGLATVAGAKSVRKTVTDRADHWKLQHDAIAQRFRLAELQYEEMRRRVLQLEEDNSALTDQLYRAGIHSVVPITQAKLAR